MFSPVINRPKIQSKLLLWMPLPLNWIKKANKNYFQEAIAKDSNIKGNFLLEGDGKGEFHASRTGLKSKLSFQDTLNLKQLCGCFKTLTVWFIITSNLKYCQACKRRLRMKTTVAFNTNNLTVSMKMASTIRRREGLVNIY